jgi:acetyl esterase/lipase
MRQVLLLGCCVLCAAAVARGADQTVLGRTLIVKNPGTPAERTITLRARETASDNALVGYPSSGGATLTITVNGGTPSAETYALPVGTSAASQKPFWTGDSLRGFKYADPAGENGPVRRALIKWRSNVFQVKVKIDGALGPVNVLPPDPGSDGCALFTIGGGDSYSMQFAGGDVKNDGAALFKVARPDAEGSCVVTTTTSTSTTTTTSTIPLPLIPPPGAAPLRYRDLVFDTVTTTSDIVYGSAVDNSGNTITLRLDFYEPTGDAVTARPLIVWVHGGSFSGGSKTSGELVDESNVFGRKGYVNASINYRLEPGGCTGSVPVTVCIIAMQEALADAQTAIRYLRDNAATYGIDTTRVAIGGSSAGAITALHVGFTSDDPATAVQAAVSLSGANILGAISSDDAPSLDFHGTADPLVPYQWAVNTVNQAVAAGLDSFLTTWVGAGHVPYVQHRTEILDQTTNFLWWEMDMANAAQ